MFYKKIFFVMKSNKVKEYTYKENKYPPYINNFFVRIEAQLEKNDKTTRKTYINKYENKKYIC
jgi:hypothetical protein